MAADFSHLSAITVDAVVRYTEKGAGCAPSRLDPRPGQPTDEMLLEAAGRLTPPLFDSLLMELLRKQLAPATQRRGRPRKGCSEVDVLIEAIDSIIRDDVPKLFLDSLRHRLADGVRYTELDRGYPFGKQRLQDDKPFLIAVIYRQLLNLIRDNPSGHVHHEVLGKLEIPNDVRGPASAALLMTQSILSGWRYHPPSLARMRNIISERNSRRFS